MGNHMETSVLEWIETRHIISAASFMSLVHALQFYLHYRSLFKGKELEDKVKSLEERISELEGSPSG